MADRTGIVGVADADWRARCHLALALCNHRKPSERLIDLIRLALEGATTNDLLDLESEWTITAVTDPADDA